jgi:zinc protease
MIAFKHCLCLLIYFFPQNAMADLPAEIPIEYFKLSNGLKVVLSPSKQAPIVTVAVYYNIGFRIEAKGRTGFAHLFEHMMFQKEFDQLIKRNGGFNNGATRFDFTSYFETMPSYLLGPVLLAEADRMKGLNLNQAALSSQRTAVKNEVKLTVINRPYGGFPWLDMPQYAHENWYNAHNFYGDFKDLAAASLEDVKKFFSTYYVPNNAALVIVGNFDTASAKKWINQYFKDISSAVLPSRPDLTEPAQLKEKRFTKTDPLINKPAIAIAYKMPERNSPEYYAMGLINQLVLEGKDSKLYQRLVKQKGYTATVNGGINYLGNMYNYDGPMLWMTDIIYNRSISPDSIIAVFDATITAIDDSISAALADLGLAKIKRDLDEKFNGKYGIDLADLLASFALFDDDPFKINRLENEFKKVTPELMRQTIRRFLNPANRTILLLQPTDTAIK